MKIHPVGSKLSHADRGTKMTKLTVALCNFANASKNVIGQQPTEGKKMYNSDS